MYEYSFGLMFSHRKALRIGLPHTKQTKKYTNKHSGVGIYRWKKEDLKTCFFSWSRSCFLSFFLGRDLGSFFFSWSISCFLSFFLIASVISFFFSWILLFSWSKACFLSFFLKSFFYKFPHLKRSWIVKHEKDWA